MSDSANPEVLSKKDKEILDRHRNIAQAYSSGGVLEGWGDTIKEIPLVAQEIADTIVSSGILPQSLGNKDKSFFISLSANSGLYEKALAEKLSKSYKIIAGDIANVKIVQSEAEPVRLDASFLPFKPESVAAMLDLKGAIWHEACKDLENNSTENVLEIFARLRTTLQEEEY